MTPEVRELCQEVILDHGKKPRNFHELAAARKAEGFNPLCGDKATVYVDLQGDSSGTWPSWARDARSPRPRPR